MDIQNYLVNPLILSPEERTRLGLDGPANDNCVAPLLVTVKQAGALLGIGKTSIFAALKSGTLERRKVNGATRVTLRSVRALAGC